MAGTPRRIHAKSIKKRQLVLDATAKVLARRGFAETTLAEIASEVGTYAGSIYYYFPSREHLIKEVLLSSVDRVSSVLEDVMKNTVDMSAQERLTAALHAVLTLYTSSKDDYSRAYMRSFNQIPDEFLSEFSTRRGKTRGLWRQLLKDAQEAGMIAATIDINVATLLVMGATNWVSTWYNPTGPLSPQAISDTFVDLLLHGMVGGKT